MFPSFRKNILDDLGRFLTVGAICARVAAAGDTSEAAATGDRWPVFLAHLGALVPDGFALHPGGPLGRRQCDGGDDTER